MQYQLDLLSIESNCGGAHKGFDFPNDKMWEVTWGYGFADRNGGTAKFNMQSNGGMTQLNDGPIPAYMGNPATSTWRWLYVNGPVTNRTVKYTFADGTIRTATITREANACPKIVWETTAP